MNDPQDVIKTPLAINMINIIGAIGTPLANMPLLAERFVEKIEAMDNPVFSIRFSNQINTGYPPRRSKKIANSSKSYFYNCIEISLFLKQRMLKPKLYNTGIVHIPGCRKISEGIAVIDIIIKLIKSLPNYQQYLENPNNLQPQIDFNKKVYTTQFELQGNRKGQINRLNLARILRSEYQLTIMYEPRTYPGVIIHYYPVPESPKITIIIQRSGKATINGGNHIKFVLMSYEFIIKVFEKHGEELWVYE